MATFFQVLLPSLTVALTLFFRSLRRDCISSFGMSIRILGICPAKSSLAVLSAADSLGGSTFFLAGGVVSELVAAPQPTPKRTVKIRVATKPRSRLSSSIHFCRQIMRLRPYARAGYSTKPEGLFRK